MSHFTHIAQIFNTIFVSEIAHVLEDTITNHYPHEKWDSWGEKGKGAHYSILEANHS